MARLVFAMMQSLDGYVSGKDGNLIGPPGDELSRHFNGYVSGIAGMLYGRRMYEIMRYWDEDRSDWDAVEHDFAALWRARPKWVVSRTLKSVGPNATLVDGGLESFVRDLRARIDGEIDVAGPELAAGIADLGFIDEYQLYLRPFVLGGGKPYFAGARPPLRLAGLERIDDTIKLTYLPA